MPRKPKPGTKRDDAGAEPGATPRAKAARGALTAPLSDDERRRLDDLYALIERVLAARIAYTDPRRTPGGHALSDAEVQHFLTHSADARLRLERALLTWEARAGKLYELMQPSEEPARRARKLPPGEFARSASELWVPSTDQLWEAAASRCERCLRDPHAFDAFAQAVDELVRIGAVKVAVTDARLKRALASAPASLSDASRALDVLSAVTSVAKNKIIAARARAVGRTATLRRREPAASAPPASDASDSLARRREQNARLIADAIERGKQRARETATPVPAPAAPRESDPEQR